MNDRIITAESVVKHYDNSLLLEDFRAALPSAGRGLHFPVPWARGEETSFLLSADAMRAALGNSGFAVRSWIDRTAEGISWFEDLKKAGKSNGSPTLGLHLVMGPDFKEMAQNLAVNLFEGRVRLIEGVAQKSSGEFAE